MAYNKVILIGNLTRDPELSTVGEFNTPLCKFGLAVNTKQRKKEEVCFIECAHFGKRAEVIAKYISKGSPLLVEGRIQQSNWEKDGVKRTAHSVIVENFTFMGKGGSSNSEPTETDDMQPNTPPEIINRPASGLPI